MIWYTKYAFSMKEALLRSYGLPRCGVLCFLLPKIAFRLFLLPLNKLNKLKRNIHNFNNSCNQVSALCS